MNKIQKKIHHLILMSIRWVGPSRSCSKSYTEHRKAWRKHLKNNYTSLEINEKPIKELFR